jgi:hypothetical protein
MRKLLSYQELLMRRQHYVQLLRSGQVKPEAQALIGWHISQLTQAINQRWQTVRLTPIERRQRAGGKTSKH